MEPSSIAFIPDGNRRFARKHGISLSEAYKRGVERAWEVLEWVREKPNFKWAAIYVLSLENLKKRSSWEKRILFSLMRKEFSKLDKLEALDVSVKFAGRIHELPKDLQQILEQAEKRTDGNSFPVYLAIAYTGRQEILDAVNKIVSDAICGVLKPPITDEIFRHYLYAPIPDPDMIVRTSGEKRLSGFLTYHSAYSELFFIEKFWPEITRRDLELVLEEYRRRERRFGR